MKKLVLIACIGLSSAAAMTQADAAPAAAKTPAFDVVSIRPYNGGGMQMYGMLPT